jgi:Zn-finger nucleic acid-binding protein
MTSRLAGDAEIDACPDCNGIWVDWFDGELAKVAHAIAPLELGTPSVGGNSLCPRCTQRLHLETIGTAHVQRCGECAGTFVPRAAFDDLATHPEPAPRKAPTALDRLLAVIRWLVHGPKFDAKD